MGDSDEDYAPKWAYSGLSTKQPAQQTQIHVPLAAYTPLQQHLYTEAVESLKFWLATAPGSFDTSPYNPRDRKAAEERCLNRFLMPNGESAGSCYIQDITETDAAVSCIHWNGLYLITGTDITRIINFRFAAFGRPVTCPKKWEEGVFSDLRNLRPGQDAQIEEPKSELINFLYRYNCIRTQKKQKIFYWYSVPQDRLFLDALDRDLKREKLGQEVFTTACSEPAIKFEFNAQKSLFDQFASATSTPTQGPDATLAERQLRRLLLPTQTRKRSHSAEEEEEEEEAGAAEVVAGMIEGSPQYKNRRPPKGSRKRQKSDNLAKATMRNAASKQVQSSAPVLRSASMQPLRSAPPAAPATTALAARPLVLDAAAFRTGTAPLTAPVATVISPREIDARSYVCPLISCGRLFKRLDLLRRHIATHSCDRPHACHRCPKRFARFENLKSHNELHVQIDAADNDGQTQLQEQDNRLTQIEVEEDNNEREELLQVVGALEALENAAEDISLPPMIRPRAGSLRPMPTSAPAVHTANRSGWPSHYEGLPDTPTAANTLLHVAYPRAQSVHPLAKSPTMLGVEVERRRPRSANGVPTARIYLDAYPPAVQIERSQSFDSGFAQPQEAGGVDLQRSVSAGQELETRQQPTSSITEPLAPRPVHFDQRVSSLMDFDTPAQSSLQSLLDGIDAQARVQQSI